MNIRFILFCFFLLPFVSAMAERKKFVAAGLVQTIKKQELL